MWHRQTSRVISRLGSEAAAVAERLERSGSVQEDILQAQERALGNQQQLMDQGRRMSKDVDAWRDNMQLMVQDFRYGCSVGLGVGIIPVFVAGPEI